MEKHSIRIQLDGFTNEIIQLQQMSKTDNLVLGGSCALLFHGLRLPREPEDIDVVVYSPTAEQIKFVENNFEPGGSGMDLESDEIRSYSKKNTYGAATLNIILERNKQLPKHCPSLKTLAFDIQVNNIDSIITAKIACAVGKNEMYLRHKDVQDLLELKNLNFNLLPQTKIEF